MATPATALSLDFSRVFLQNPVSLRLFTRFLEGEFSQENLLFYLAVEDFKSECSRCHQLQQGGKGGEGEHHHKLLTRAKEIFEKYISGASEYAVNLGFNVVQSVQEKMSSLHRFVTQPPSPSPSPSQSPSPSPSQSPSPSPSQPQDQTNDQPQPPFQLSSIACDIFGEAQDNVFQLMKMDSYPRFIKSDIYLELLQFRGHLEGNQRHPLEQMVSEGFMQAAERQEGWDEVKEQDGVIISRKKVADIYCMRGVGIVDAPPAVVYELVSDVNKRKLWDDMFCAGHEVERLGSNLVVYYMAWNSPNKLAFNRDFVVLRVVRENKEDGSFLCASKSVAHPDVPARQGFVRGEMESSGFIIRPCGSSQSLVVYLAQIDPKGKIPKTIENFVSQQRPLYIAKIRRILQERSNNTSNTSNTNSNSFVKPMKNKVDEDQWRGASSSRRMNRVSVYVPNSRIFNIANNVTDINPALVGASVAELMNNFNSSDFSSPDATPAPNTAPASPPPAASPIPTTSSSSNVTPAPSANPAAIDSSNDSNDGLNVVVTPTTVPSTPPPFTTPTTPTAELADAKDTPNDNNGGDDGAHVVRSPSSGDNSTTSTKSNSKLDVSYKPSPNDNTSPTSKSNSNLNLSTNNSTTSKSNSKLNLSSNNNNANENDSDNASTKKSNSKLNLSSPPSDDAKTKGGSKLNLQSSSSGSSVEGESDTSQPTKKSNSKLNVSGNTENNEKTTKRTNSKLHFFSKGDDEKPKKGGSKLSVSDQSNIKPSDESADNATKKSSSGSKLNISESSKNETPTNNTNDPNTPHLISSASAPTSPATSPTPTRNNAAEGSNDDAPSDATTTPKQTHDKPKRSSKLNFFGDKKSKSQSSLPVSAPSSPSQNHANKENDENKGGLWHKATKRFQSKQKNFLDPPQ